MACFSSPSDEPLVPLSSELPVTLSSKPPALTPEVHPEQVIEANLVVNLEESDRSEDDLEQIDDLRGILDH